MREIKFGDQALPAERCPPPPLGLWADCENHIKELDYEFASGTDRPILHTLSTLRHQRFAQPSLITHEGRRHLLKLPTAVQKA